MTNPITPTPKLVLQWLGEYIIDGAGLFLIDETSDRVELADGLRAARRPKQLSLKEQALSLIDDCTDSHGDDLDDDILGGYLDHNSLSIIRTALEALPDD